MSLSEQIKACPNALDFLFDVSKRVTSFHSLFKEIFTVGEKLRQRDMLVQNQIKMLRIGSTF